MTLTDKFASATTDARTVLQGATQFQVLLKQRRSESGLSYHALSERACVDVAYLQGLETGKKSNPSRDIVIRIGVGLGLDLQGIDELIIAAGHLPIIRQRPAH